MASRRSQPKVLRYFAAAVAVVAVVGYAVFGWRWGSTDPVPTAIGVAVALVAVGWTLYQRR